MWSKEEAPYIQSLLNFSSNIVETSCHDVVSDSEIACTSGWENIRPQAIYRSNRHSGRRKIKVASSPATRTRQNTNNQSPSSHVMRGTLDDSWNYRYPTVDKTGNETAAERETARDKVQEIVEDTVKESTSNDQWPKEEIHVQKLREAIAALVKEPLSSHRTSMEQSVSTSSQPGDNTTHRWAVDKPRIPHVGTQLMTQLRGKQKSTQGTVPHHIQGVSLNASSQLLHVRQLPVATCKEQQTVQRHKVLDPTIRYELSQLVQSQLYSRLLVEQQSINDQLLKVSSVMLLPSSSSSSAQHNELHASHSYPNISTSSRNCSFNGRTPMHKLSLPKRF